MTRIRNTLRAGALGACGLLYASSEMRWPESMPRPIDFVEHGRHPLPYAIVSYGAVRLMNACTGLRRQTIQLSTLGSCAVLASLYETDINPIPNTQDWVDVAYSIAGSAIGIVLSRPDSTETTVQETT